MYSTLTQQLTHILSKSLDIPYNTRNRSFLLIPRCILPLILVNIQSCGNKNLPITFLWFRCCEYICKLNLKIFRINEELFIRLLWG
ncbi:hypothetical protein Peur_046945 [Populus x canadensis]